MSTDTSSADEGVPTSRLGACASWVRSRPGPAALAGLGAVVAIAASGFLKPVLAVAIVAGAVAVLRAQSSTPVEGARPGGAAALASNRAARTAGLVFGIPGALLFAGGLYLAVQQEWTILGARIVPATVVDTALAEPRTTRRGATLYRPAVRHRYIVDGRQFESDRLYPRIAHLDERYAGALLAMYRPGQRVFTRVPRGHPGSAYLAPRRIWIGHGMLALGLLILGGVGLALRVSRSRASKAVFASTGRAVVQR